MKRFAAIAGISSLVLCATLSWSASPGLDPNAPPPVQTNISRMKFTPEQQAVWNAIDKQWGRSGCCGRENLWGPNIRWLDLLAEDAMVWFWGDPAPTDRESERMWSDLVSRPEKPWAAKRIAYELYPQGLVIHGNTAVAHYRFKDTEQGPDGKLSTSNGRFTDVLVRDRPNGPWMLLSWVGGSLPKG